MTPGMLNGVAIFLAGYIAMMASAAALEPLKVGQAEIIRNEVVNVGDAQIVPINIGDVVMRDEIVRTSADSDARIGLLDDTKLTLGPGSTLKIDRAVYSGETSYRQITIRLTSGAFRFITGHSDKKSYRIETPFASIGVRGTILDIQVLPNQTLVSLQDGQASVCAGTRCTQLLQRGHTANVLREGGVTQIRRELTPSWTFASVCAGNSALCTPLPAINALRKANLTVPGVPGSKATKKLDIVRFCPNGQPMVGGSCGPSQDLARDTSLPPLNGTTGDSSLPSLNSPLSPSIPSTVDRGGLDLPQVNPPAGRLSIPTLRR
jgi:FecR-like protein